MAYTPLDPTVLTGVLNNQGTQATSAHQLTQIALAQTGTSIAGTTNLYLANGNAIATVVMNDQGTLASASNQAYTNSILQSIYAQAGSSTGSVVTSTLFDTQVGAATSVAVDVTGRVHNTVQHIVTGTCAITTQTSLDGSYWHTENVSNQSTLLSLAGIVKYVRATVSGGGTVTSKLMSSPPPPTSSGLTASLSESQFSLALSQTDGATTVLPLNNANGVGLRLVVPTGSIIWFEGSWDGINWEAVTLRQMGGHGYSTGTGSTDNWIGSVSTFNYLRFRTQFTGSAPGSVLGKLTYQQNTVEGIEHGYMPHRIGAQPYAVVMTIGSICTNQVIYTPTNPFHRLVITDVYFNGAGLTTVTLTEGGTRPVFRSTLRPSGGTPVAQMSYRIPVPFQSAGNNLCFTNSANQDVDINIHLYEAEE